MVPQERVGDDPEDDEPPVEGGKYQLKVIGPDDDFSKEITLEPSVHEYCIAGLTRCGGLGA